MDKHDSKNDDPLVVVVPAVWFRLMDGGTGKTLPTTYLPLVHMDAVEDLQEVVVTECGLEWIESSVLNVFGNKIAYDSQETMSMVNLLGECGSKYNDLSSWRYQRSGSD
ncbi:unnamed protein product [Phytophthora lilii]|uniref:Unnamed protein product n=1 Tax=Phytophthora lilii TaxID=2077276 RepID=A0A9W6U8C0_9STRA|nr:unnamed protein product [Phytophthora lilii]